MISLEYLIKSTGAKPEVAAKFLDALNETMERFEINTPQRIAGFLSQIGHESAHLTALSENLNYRVEALAAVFGRSRISEEDAKAFGRNDATGQKANQEQIANRVYGGQWGAINLGNTQEGDGWRFRGRGLKQLTGRFNYQRCGEGLGVDLISDPDLLLTPEYAAASAGWFWNNKGCSRYADAGDIVGLTKVINGGTNGLTSRQELYAAAMEHSGSMMA